MSASRQPVLFISHGGGPWSYVDEMRAQFSKTETWLRQLPSTLPERPKAIVSISGHWEETHFTVATSMKPPMIYDYQGFPAHTYSIRYEAPGSLVVARRVLACLSGFETKEDAEHGFDHGTFVPIGLMYPNAEVPIVSLSLKENLDPLEHIEMGRALVPLRNEGVLIIGSGLTYHNLRMFGPAGSDIAREFEKWLTLAVSQPDAAERNRLLCDWQSAPHARRAHPREDHLLPLMVASGAAGLDQGRRDFLDEVRGISMASYRFG